MVLLSHSHQFEGILLTRWTRSAPRWRKDWRQTTVKNHGPSPPFNNRFLECTTSFFIASCCRCGGRRVGNMIHILYISTSYGTMANMISISRLGLPSETNILLFFGIYVRIRSVLSQTTQEEVREKAEPREQYSVLFFFL